MHPRLVSSAHYYQYFALLCHPARAIAATILSRTGAAGRSTIAAVGHCHIDTAWLWPYDETKRKVARSWSSAVTLIESGRYPSYKFCASSAQQYAWLKQGYPALFERVAAAVDGGSFLPVSNAPLRHARSSSLCVCGV